MKLIVFRGNNPILSSPVPATGIITWGELFEWEKENPGYEYIISMAGYTTLLDIISTFYNNVSYPLNMFKMNDFESKEVARCLTEFRDINFGSEFCDKNNFNNRTQFHYLDNEKNQLKFFNLEERTYDLTLGEYESFIKFLKSCGGFKITIHDSNLIEK